MRPRAVTVERPFTVEMYSKTIAMFLNGMVGEKHKGDRLKGGGKRCHPWRRLPSELQIVSKVSSESEISPRNVRNIFRPIFSLACHFYAQTEILRKTDRHAYSRQRDRKANRRRQTEVRVEGRIDMQTDIQADRQTDIQTVG